MKVLHIWNTAGVGSIIAKYMDRIYGTQSWVIMRKRFDKFGFTTYGECWDCRAKIFTLKALWMARKYDLFHVHAFDEVIPLLKMLYRGKRVVLHYHGTDIRGRWNKRQKYWSKADLIVVSTPDLLEGAPNGVVYLPNPVDTKLFYAKCKPEPETAFHISYFADDLAEKVAEQHGLKLVIHNREEKPIPYTEFAEVLSRYEYYIDIKRSRNQEKVLKRLSKTALEALACGCKVIQWDGQVINSLSLDHHPEVVAEKVWRLYNSLIKE